MNLAFSMRLENAEAACNRVCLEARKALSPDSTACWLESAGTTAFFDGVGSPLTQTFGLGLQGEPDEAEFRTLEEFFANRGADVQHEVSPLTSPRLLECLHSRGYRVCELTNMLWLDLSRPRLELPRSLRTRPIDLHDCDHWAHLSAAGWSDEAPDLIEFCQAMGRMFAHCPVCHCFYAEKDGQPISTASLFIIEDIAVLAGASTPKQYRRQGGQSALLQARLDYAREQGCQLAMMGAQPGSRSQTNAESVGFQVAYTRLKWKLG